MSNSRRGFWASIARKLVHRGGIGEEAGFVSKRRFAKLKNTVEKIRNEVAGTWTVSEEGEGELPKVSDEAGLYREVIKLRQGGLKDDAMRLLVRNESLATKPDEFLVMKAWLAYEHHSDSSALEYLAAAVDAAKPGRKKLFWGPVAIISNAYWSRAMCEAGYESETLMWDVSHINHRNDFDLLIDDVMPSWLPFSSRDELMNCGSLAAMFGFLHIVRHASVSHMPFTGGFLGGLRIWKSESDLLRRAGIKTVLLPFGGDYYCISRIFDPSLRYGLLANYPQLGKLESTIQDRVTHWQQEADCVVAGFQVDAIGRWDVTLFQFVHIDEAMWAAKTEYSAADGRNGEVRVIHTPNHRGFKGTEFLVQAVDELRSEGLQVKLQLLERVPNAEVRRLMPESDILAEQFIATAYALSGIEGMASGLPVMANLESEYYTRVFRRYSFLNECPIFSTTPETLKDNLRILITNPKLREELGRAGRTYVEKYHSLSEARHLFGSIYDRILHGREIDLINLYHPVTSAREKQRPKVKHPLIENRLPRSLV